MTEHESSSGFVDPAAFPCDVDLAVALIADRQIRAAIERGAFDDLPGAGKPLDLDDHLDPDWWLKGLVKREQLAMLPPSIELRRDDAALDERLDTLTNEKAVRHEIAEFNTRVVRARFQPPAGPPLVTMPRDTEATVAAWAERRAARAEEARRRADEAARATERRRRWPRFRARRRATDAPET
ncbi:DUF1992 domain-containing protein [Pseudoclavibacter chungangensis]|uniref:DUF1992 domain-containing protein n=1 Tax=Pseudoclavibacter chungangensis TaxID=587635 RepID=A0A7J5BMK9_9MICO|nr:DUF1992 domain-containing protein [Pseudoclavibacter chungangensis]KAB1652306.1 DUF1992 domain-containing protein [Pseudoclavibacter chungangensis]NYJ66912.1 hypothetical protein [Pseudoclavibacter chungangensis]